MIHLTIFNVILSYSLMTRPCFLLLKCPKEELITWITTQRKKINGLSCRKWASTIGLLRKFQQVLPRSSLITIYRAFIRPHLDYEDVFLDQAFNNSSHQRLESIQYNATLAITGAIRETSKESFIKNFVSSTCSPVDDFENYLSFTK